MGIDRIGKGSGPPPSGPTGPRGPGSAEGAARPFEVKRPTEPANAAGVAGVSPAGTSPLEQLRAGKIDVNGYVDLKVDAATSHLHGMDAAELADVKKTLRDQIASDPALSDLVKQATGSTPLPRDD
jgi:hypothetical protein